ncbi:MurR/RpiR family transcriptional regulator [Falsiroseomonas sp.]|uniref:MurR/RpiR family transcriptional regulator n=1 Tax=Falsiroseomonas sp. TaxID=2870721 RepID=UPI0027371E6B|nr:MurR/RpiR family transcriptional regulator [Falsiroseomonas sp.]MDP3416840.1 MurR/RpiR family transcriptional regulator [Falsiroseomonas sp.]
MRARIAEILDRLSPAERKVAELVAADPEGAMGANLAGLARSAGVSEPTVIRFCRSLGLKGFADLRLALARGEAAAGPARHAITPDMPLPRVAEAVLDGAGEVLAALRASLDRAAIERAALALLRAARVEIWGCGASAALAQDLAFSLFGLCRGVAARHDPQMQAMAAAALDGDAVAICLCGTGRAPAMVALAKQAAEAGATVIALAPPHTPLAAAATLLLPCPLPDAPEPQAARLSRLAPLLLGDALAVSVSLLSPPAVRDRLARMQAARGD